MVSVTRREEESGRDQRRLAISGNPAATGESRMVWGADAIADAQRIPDVPLGA